MGRKNFTAERYEGLELSPEFSRLLNEHPERLSELCNGVGSTVGELGTLTYHVIPNTIWGLDITPASDIHDVDYTFPVQFSSEGAAILHKKAADLRFKNNVIKLIERADKTSFLRRVGAGFIQDRITALRKQRARLYYFALRVVGDESFLDGKKIG